MDYKISVDLLAGFKGSGKTSFINKLAGYVWSKEKTLFIQNETGIESLSINNIKGNWKAEEITGGCICCTGNAYLETTIEKAVKEYRPQKIVLELAQTANIRDVYDLILKIKSADCYINRLFYIINAADFYKRMFISEIFLKDQLAIVPLVVLNRSLKLSEEKTEEIIGFLKSANSQIEIVNDCFEEPTSPLLDKLLLMSEFKGIKDKKSPKSFTNLGFKYSDFINN